MIIPCLLLVRSQDTQQNFTTTCLYTLFLIWNLYSKFIANNFYIKIAIIDEVGDMANKASTDGFLMLERHIMKSW